MQTLRSNLRWLRLFGHKSWIEYWFLLPRQTWIDALGWDTNLFYSNLIFCQSIILHIGDRISSIFVHPGCSITLYQHYLPGCAHTGKFHTFTEKNNQVQENKDLRKVSLDNTVSRYVIQYNLYYCIGNSKNN